MFVQFTPANRRQLKNPEVVCWEVPNSVLSDSTKVSEASLKWISNHFNALEVPNGVMFIPKADTYYLLKDLYGGTGSIQQAVNRAFCRVINPDAKPMGMDPFEPVGFRRG